MPTIKFANILLEKSSQSLSYPSLYCRANGEIVKDKTSG